MKERLVFVQFVLLLIIFSFYAFSEESFLISEKTLEPSYYLALSDEGNVLVFSNIVDEWGKRTPVMLIFDKNGNLLSSKKVESGISFARGIKKLSDGNFLLFGGCFSEGDMVTTEGLIKLSKDGEIIWKKVYQLPNFSNIRGVIESSDGGFLLWFSFTDPDNYYNELSLLLKTNPEGSVLWEKSFQYFGAMTEIQGEGFFISSIYGDFTSSLFKLDYDGNILWKKNIKSGGILWIGGMVDFDGKLAVSCAVQDKDLSLGCGILILDKDGNLISKKGFIIEGIDDFGTSIRKMNDGFIVRGPYVFSGDGYIWLLRLSSHLDLIWENCFGYRSGSDGIYDICESSGGRYYAIGGYYMPLIRKRAFFLMKLDSEGELGCRFEHSISSVTSDFDVTIDDDTVPSATDITPCLSDIDFSFDGEAELNFYSLCSSCPTIEIEPSSLKDGRAGEFYQETLSAQGGSVYYKFSISSGILPQRLSLSESGVLSGTPSEGGDYNFTVTATDSTYCSGSKDYTIHIEIVPPTILSVQKLSNPFRLKISGSNFHSDLKVYIGSDSNAWEYVKYKSSSEIVLKGGSALKSKFPKGVPVEIKIVNGDGGSATYQYTR